jgi:hypothetical protein
VAVAPRAQEPAMFSFRAGFWLHLHHFLYVLGRADARLPDATRRAVEGAGPDQAAGLASAAPEEAAAWRRAVTAYASDLSRKDAVFDEPMWRVTAALAPLDEDAALPAADLPAEVKTALEEAAPIYRRIWWPEHGRRSRGFVDNLQTWLRLEGSVIQAFVTWAFDERWPAEGFRVEVSSYANWAGAYSTGDGLLVLSSRDPGVRDSQGLETLFHEAMHQWDEAMLDRLKEAAKRRNRARVPDGLLHALVFYTAGEAVKRTIPPHVPYAELNGLWKSGPLAAFKPVLDTRWRSRLRGDADLDEALEAVLAAAP